MTDIDKIIAGLSEAQRDAILSFRQEPRQMGIGLAQLLPGMVEAGGFTHPIFGTHYHLTRDGQAVCAALLRDAGQ